MVLYPNDYYIVAGIVAVKTIGEINKEVIIFINGVRKVVPTDISVERIKVIIIVNTEIIFIFEDDTRIVIIVDGIRVIREDLEVEVA